MFGACIDRDVQTLLAGSGTTRNLYLLYEPYLTAPIFDKKKRDSYKSLFLWYTMLYSGAYP